MAAASDTDLRDKEDNDQWRQGREKKIKTKLVRAVVKIGRNVERSDVLDSEVVLELYFFPFGYYTSFFLNK